MSRHSFPPKRSKAKSWPSPEPAPSGTYAELHQPHLRAASYARLHHRGNDIGDDPAVPCYRREVVEKMTRPKCEACFVRFPLHPRQAGAQGLGPRAAPSNFFCLFAPVIFRIVCVGRRFSPRSANVPPRLPTPIRPCSVEWGHFYALKEKGPPLSQPAPPAAIPRFLKACHRILAL